MKWLSFNCRGMASASKKLTLHRLFDTESVDIIITLGDADLITISLQSLKPGWHFYSLDAMGCSGGLTIRYNPRTIKVIPLWRGLWFIGMDILSVEIGMDL